MALGKQGLMPPVGLLETPARFCFNAAPATEQV